MIAASRFFVALGTIFKSVTKACWRADPHLQDLPAGTSRTAVRSAFCAFSALCFKVAMICDAVNDSFSEKSRDAILGPVKELIRNEKFSRPQIFLERTNRADGDDALHAQ